MSNKSNSSVSILIRTNSDRRRPTDFWRKLSFISPEVVNPFFFRLYLPWYDWLKIGFFSITLAPIRLIIVAILFLIACCFANLVRLCQSAKNKDKPISGCRKFIIIIVCLLLRLGFFFIGFVWIEVIGSRSSSSAARILVCAPHTSVFDGILAYLSSSDCLSVLSRQENADMPFIGSIVALTQPILVNRYDENSRHTTLEKIKERCLSLLPWPQLLIFPEGTCTNGTCLINFKIGAFACGAPVQPVLIQYPNRIKTVIWTGEGNNVVMQVWLTLCQLYTNMTIEYLPVYTPSVEEKADSKLYASNVRKVMADKLGLPITDHSFEDCRLMHVAEQFDLPTCSGIVEFSKLSRKLNINFGHMEQMLSRFATLSRNLYGHMTIVEFSECLNMPITPELEDMFRLFDRDDSGTIDFREYAIGLSLITPSWNTEEAIRLTFRIFDKNGKGHIDRLDLSRLLTGAFGLSDADVDQVWSDLDPESRGLIDCDGFVRYMNNKPELVRILAFLQSRDMKYWSHETAI